MLSLRISLLPIAVTVALCGVATSLQPHRRQMRVGILKLSASKGYVIPYETGLKQKLVSNATVYARDIIVINSGTAKIVQKNSIQQNLRTGSTTVKYAVSRSEQKAATTIQSLPAAVKRRSTDQIIWPDTEIAASANHFVIYAPGSTVPQINVALFLSNQKLVWKGLVERSEYGFYRNPKMLEAVKKNASHNGFWNLYEGDSTRALKFNLLKPSVEAELVLSDDGYLSLLRLARNLDATKQFPIEAQVLIDLLSATPGVKHLQTRLQELKSSGFWKG